MSRKHHDTPTAPAMDSAAAVWLPLSALRPNPRNPRAHGAEVQRLARTIVRTTWGAPIIAQASTHRIIGGHGRLEAARLIMAGIEVDGIARGGADHRFDRSAPAPGLVPVRLVDVSDAEADAMTLADNAHALQGRDDSAAVVALAAGFGRSTGRDDGSGRSQRLRPCGDYSDFRLDADYVRGVFSMGASVTATTIDHSCGAADAGARLLLRASIEF